MSNDVNELVYEALNRIVKAYELLTRVFNSKLSGRVLQEILTEVVRITINELARQLMFSTYPELDNLPERQYALIDTLIPALMEKYILDNLGIESRTFNEIIEEISISINNVDIDEEAVRKLYDMLRRSIESKKLDSFIKYVSGGTFFKELKNNI